MFKYLKQYRFYITLFLFVLIPIIAIDTNSRAPRQYRFYDQIIVNLTWPIQTAITWSFESIVSTFNNYVFLFRTRQQNLELIEENRKLFNTILNLKEAAVENTRLRNLLDFKETLSLSTVLARVIAKDVSTEFRAIRINRGESVGIKKDMAVVNSEGVVGRVFRTTADTADVITVLDLLSAVDAIVDRSRVRGIVEGLTDESCQLKFALRTDDIQVGDLLISSGLGGVFPKGVPVGTVASVTKKPYGISQDVLIRPSVDFSRLEEVFVIATGSKSAPIHLSSHSFISGIPQSSKPAQPAPLATPAPTPAPTKSKEPAALGERH